MRLPFMWRLSVFCYMRARYDHHTARQYPEDCLLKHRFRHMGIKDWPMLERPREKLLANGAQCLSDAELLAVVVGASGRRGSDAVSLARDLLVRHGSLRGLLTADRRASLKAGLGLVGFCRMQAAIELTRRHYAEALRA